MSTTAIQFGVWAPVHGPHAALDDPAEPFDVSWAHNKRVVLEAEALGFDSTLIAQHTVNPHLPKSDQLETWTAAAALTSRVEIIAAIKPAVHLATRRSMPAWGKDSSWRSPGLRR